MAEWNKNKVEPSAINNGQEFKLKDNLAIDELNAIVNNSFYASDKAKRAEELAESVVKGNGTNVTIDGKIQGEWSADFVENEKTISGENNSNPITHNNDAPVVFAESERQKSTTYGPITHNLDASVVFAESERQKSKNLLVYPYTGEVYQYGVTFTDNGDGSFTINGKQTDTTANSYHYMETADIFKLSAGTYTLKAFADTSVTGWNLVLYDGEYYHEVSSPNITRTITLNEDKACHVYIQVPKASTTTFNNFVVKPILVKGTEVGEWQPYNGAIVHEKDIQPNIATAKLDSSYSFASASTYEKLPITLYSSSGDKLRVEDNAIYIGKGVNKVKVSGVVQFTVSDQSDVYFAINKNANRIFFGGETSSKGARVISIPPFMINTGEDNYFTLWAYSSVLKNSVDGSSSIITYLTVEVVE